MDNLELESKQGKSKSFQEQISDLIDSKNINPLSKELLETYDKVMLLKIYVDKQHDETGELKQKYIDAMDKHNLKIVSNMLHIDAGFDLYLPQKQDFYNKNLSKDNCENPKDYSSSIVSCVNYFIMCSATMIQYDMRNVSQYDCEQKIKKYNTGYYLYPRSSVSKTVLRLANSTGIIDSGYRGHLMAMMDVDTTHFDKYVGEKFDRYVQLCAPGLFPIIVQVVDSLEELGEQTERGSGGFGSTGK